MVDLIKDDSLVLFQGDSITDARRIRTNYSELGNGYSARVADLFSAKYPEKNVTFINRGVGGDTVESLQARWNMDCEELKPDWVSILIGINDAAIGLSDEKYEKGYRDILTRTINETNAKLVICEPFLIPISENIKKLRDNLESKIYITRQLAREYSTIYIPLDGIFASVCTKKEPVFWALDGVHPTNAGHALIALEWMKALGY